MVSTWMGDRLGTPRVVDRAFPFVLFFSLSRSALGSFRRLESYFEFLEKEKDMPVVIVETSSTWL